MFEKHPGSSASDRRKWPRLGALVVVSANTFTTAYMKYAEVTDSQPESKLNCYFPG